MTQTLIELASRNIDYSHWISSLQDVKSQSEVIYQLSKEVIQNEEESSNPTTTTATATTALLHLVRRVLERETFNIPVIAFFLQFQSRYLNDVTCFRSFFLLTKAFTSRLTKEDVHRLRREVGDISYRVTKLACATGKAKAVAGFLLHLADLASFSKSSITAIDVDFLQVSITGQLYGLALRYLQSRDFFEVDLQKSTLTPAECLRFFYYKGICHLAEKDFLAAVDSFLIVLSLPLPHLSAIAVKALKKCKLASLILNKSPLELPNYINPFLSSYAQEAIEGYDDICSAFKARDITRLKEVITKHTNILNSDQNLGLAKQVMRALKELLLQNLSQAYITVPMQEVCKKLELEDKIAAKKWIVDCVGRGGIRAEIDDSNEMVRFPGLPPSNLAELDGLLGTAFQKMAELSDALRAKHSELLTSSSYISKIASAGKGFPSKGLTPRGHFPSSVEASSLMI